MTKQEMNNLIKIAQENFVALENRSDLESKNSNEQDFMNVAVWEIKEALIKAYELGKGAKQ